MLAGVKGLALVLLGWVFGLCSSDCWQAENNPQLFSGEAR